MIRKTLLAVLVSGAMVSGVQAAGNQVNGYLFGNVGQADYDFGSYFKPYIGSVDDTDTAFKVGAGVQLLPWVGIEFQYLDLGEATYKERSPTYKETIEVSGYGANVVGTLPLNRFKLYGKLGYHQLEADYKAKDASGSASSSKKDWITSYAVGATFAITPQFEVALEYERYNEVKYRDLADGRNVEADIDLASIGLRYNF